MTARIATISGVLLALATLEAATLSKQQAELFSRKVQQIVVQGDRVQQPGKTRTPVTEGELNSWFAYSATPLLPAGVAEPRITLVGNGKVAGQAIVDLDAIAKRKQSGGAFDVWSLVGGKVPVNVLGTLKTKDGLGSFQIESADVSGLPLPKTVLQDLVSYYSRTPAHPQGVKLDDSFELPASIRQIDVSAGQAVIVQ